VRRSERELWYKIAEPLGRAKKKRRGGRVWDREKLDEITVTVDPCVACGGTHYGVKAKKFATRWTRTHWAMCPVKNEPLCFNARGKSNPTGRRVWQGTWQDRARSIAWQWLFYGDSFMGLGAQLGVSGVAIRQRIKAEIRRTRKIMMANPLPKGRRPPWARKLRALMADALSAVPKTKKSIFQEPTVL
jgi:hypothetical protein